jgi:DNA-binding SARP family transcriptional activator/tetratricopeptide (TPR) repeat protein
MAVEFCLLGSVEVRSGGRLLDVGHARQRCVLAVLLAEANRVVAAGQLVDRVWGGDRLPASPVSALQTYVSLLRRAMAPAGDVVIARQASGYKVVVDADTVDLHRFRSLIAEARAARDDDDRAAASLEKALGLWRGEPFAGLDSPWISATRSSLVMQRQAAQLDLTDIQLRRGQHAALVSDLSLQASDHPLDERAAGQLMLALYRSGRQAGALEHYEQLRRRLADELGADPGPPLRLLHQQILAADPTLDIPTTSTPPAAPPGPSRPPAPAPEVRYPLPPDTAAFGRDGVPRELPALAAHYVGRATEHAYLTGLLDQRDEPTPGTLVISAIGGTAGVGKTALAVHWAHQAAEHFPDGQLYVNLRGYDPAQPVAATDVLARFLRSLGEPGQYIPREEDERAARYRSLLAGKRMLILLDNAGSADQVRPLLPGNPACRVIVTSRDALAGLVARDGATRLDVDALPLQDAVALLRTLIGARVDAEPTAAAELAGQCCRLPLALRVAAELAADRPTVPLARLVDELADLRTRLDLLEADGDPGTGMRAVFSWSYRHLNNEDARTSRLLGLHPGPDVEAYEVAALTGMTVRQAHRALDVLARAHLLCPAPPSRHGMHDLLRAYARELTATVDTEQEQHAALTRLFDHYLYTAATAMDALFPAERNRRPRIPRPATPARPFADPAAAREWLDSERAALMAAVAYTADHDWPAHAIRLAATLFRYLYSSGHLAEALTVSSHALSTARRTGDLIAEATALSQIGSVDGQQGRLQQAAEHHWRALALLRAAGDRAGEAHALGNLGLPEMGLGRYEQAARHQQEALAISRDIGDRFGEARALGNLGWARQKQGRYQEAAGYYQQTLALSRDIGDRQGEGNTLGRLGAIDLRLRRYQRAAGYFQQALALFHEMDDTSGEAEGVISLGEVYLRLGRYEQAAANFEHASAMSRELSDRVLEANAQNGLGDVLFRTGDVDKARAHHANALRLASETGSPDHQARAHSGLARTYRADRDSLQAGHHWQEALTYYTAIGAPEALEIRARLAAIGDSDDGHPPSEEGDGATATSPR